MVDDVWLRDKSVVMEKRVFFGNTPQSDDLYTVDIYRLIGYARDLSEETLKLVDGRIEICQ